MLVQLRFATGLSSGEYVRREYWREATLDRCPHHLMGGCGVRGHGTYERKHPRGVLVPRWYCRAANSTISLLPDFLCARLPGTLDEAEGAVAAAEEAASVEAAADAIRPDGELPGAIRWLRRRIRGIRAALTSLLGLLGDLPAGVQPTVTSFREAIGVSPVLVRVREIAALHLRSLPPPLGFGPRPSRRSSGLHCVQHEAGPDPPSPIG
jgi:hypothetical protein